MAMTTMLLALAAAATALPEDHPTCLAACAGLSCARFAPATCAMVERDLGCACAGCACAGSKPLGSPPKLTFRRCFLAVVAAGALRGDMNEAK